MLLRPNLIITTVFASLLGSGAGFAAITAEDVWQAMTDTYGSVGLKSTATQTRTGNIVTISDWTMIGAFPEQMGGSISFSTSGLTLTENGDGTVSLAYPESMPIALALTLPDDRYLTANFELVQSGYTETLSGDPDNIRFEYAAQSMALVLKNIAAPDMPFSNLHGEMRYDNIANSGSIQRGDMVNVTQAYQSGTVTLTFSSELKGVDGKMDYSAVYDGYGGTFAMQLPAGGVDFMNLPALLRAGMMLKADMDLGKTTTNMLMTALGEVMQKQNLTVENTQTTFEFSKDGFNIFTKAKGYLVDMIDQQIPFPIKLQLPYVGVALEMPLLKSDAEQKFRVMYDFRDITFDETLWALAAPINQLPHDPITLTFDISGTGQLYYDLLDFETMARVIDTDEIPGDITGFNINTLNIAAAGASLTGSGAFNINTKDLETFDGFPALDGTADIKITGSNALIDQLIELRLVEENEAMGARMMMGIFMKAGEGEDVLTSTIDVTKDGQVSANGQRLK